MTEKTVFTEYAKVDPVRDTKHVLSRQQSPRPRPSATQLGQAQCNFYRAVLRMIKIQITEGNRLFRKFFSLTLNNNGNNLMPVCSTAHGHAQNI